MEFDGIPFDHQLEPRITIGGEALLLFLDVPTY